MDYKLKNSNVYLIGMPERENKDGEEFRRNSVHNENILELSRFDLKKMNLHIKEEQ